MIIGIGIDIIEIERIKESVENFGDKFLNKIFTEGELVYCLSRPNKYQHLAARFAAKEAIVKALSSGKKNGFRWKDIEIFNEANGMPFAELHGDMIKHLGEGNSLKISMSHSHNYVTCVALAHKTI